VRNRRYFDERLAGEWSRAVRNGSELTVVLLDVDFFKRYNDHYGHQAGDACLRRVATCLRHSLKRPGDLAARYGGEEFACLLPDTDLTGGLEIAHRLRDAVQALDIAHADSAVAPVVTVSLGVCSTSGNTPGSAGALLRGADAQLYLAKADGRNRSRGGSLQACSSQPGF
jgi:diguanylate cyclase (GGDEF)-like protein